jgi:hypothetical protein
MRKQPSWMKGLLKACEKVERIGGRRRPAKKAKRKAARRKTPKRKAAKRKTTARRATSHRTAARRAPGKKRVRVSKPTASAIKALVRWDRGGSQATSTALVPYTGSRALTRRRTGSSALVGRRPKGVSKKDWKRIMREARRGAAGERHRKRRSSSAHPSTSDVSAWKAFLDST